eukprot:TRINITY_DN3560_c0_g1_i5.p3 TRINITY_DN3560_c0_g1~~TRINITY_DN3560_c0_g1_i5.p3  ORF type:complete len:137 (-),score=34.50 TRINITY_DN3560_c0_g1_i5:24-434(-)
MMLQLLFILKLKKTSIKKSPDIKEIGLGGNKESKLALIKNYLPKEITIKDVIKEGIIDIRGVTKGKGFQGTIKRFGLNFKSHKSCLLYTSDAADDMQCVDLGGRRIIKKKKKKKERQRTTVREHSKTDDQKATTAG